MAIIQIDADLLNSDWVKQGYDLPIEEELEEILLSQDMTMTKFKNLPAYYLPKEKNNANT